MGFSAKQVKALRRNLDNRFVRTRQGSDGRELSYLEGWYAISEANRIFGFDGWSRETVESKCILARENRGSFLAVYTARVRITVRTKGATIIREGHGTGEGRGTSPGEIHDIALKAAETDATKRALATFGKPFGLELYRKDKAGPTFIGMTASPPTVPGSPAAYSAAPTPRHGFHPDDTTPIPRPSTYYGRDRYAAMREQAKENARQHSSSSTNTATMSTNRQREATEALFVPAAISAPLALSTSLHSSPGRIDKSALTIAEPKRLRDKTHLKFVASQPCLVCGRQPSDPHHLRFAQPRAIGMKVSDEFTVPLCRGHHRELHRYGDELAWWGKQRLEPLSIASTLWRQTHPLPARPQLSAPPNGSATEVQNAAGGKDVGGQIARSALPHDETSPIVPTGSQ